MDLPPASAGQKTKLQGGAKSSMHLSQPLRRYWPEMLLFLRYVAVAISRGARQCVALASGLVWLWSIAVALLGLLAWPLAASVRRRAKNEARRALADLAEPSAGWNAAERDAWSAVLQTADTAIPLGFTELETARCKGARDCGNCCASLPSRGP